MLDNNSNISKLVLLSHERIPYTGCFSQCSQYPFDPNNLLLTTDSSHLSVTFTLSSCSTDLFPIHRHNLSTIRRLWSMFGTSQGLDYNEMLEYNAILIMSIIVVGSLSRIQLISLTLPSHLIRSSKTALRRYHKSSFTSNYIKYTAL